jgi:hypothetical protein
MAKPTFNHKYEIRLSDQEAMVLQKSASDKEMTVKNYIISLIVLDNLRQTWHKTEMQKTQLNKTLNAE